LSILEHRPTAVVPHRIVDWRVVFFSSIQRVGFTAHAGSVDILRLGTFSELIWVEAGLLLRLVLFPETVVVLAASSWV
jgi:hypothetical protein